MAKTYFNKRVLTERHEYKQAAFEKLVEESLSQISAIKLRRLLKSNRAYITKLLQQQAQNDDQ